MDVAEMVETVLRVVAGLVMIALVFAAATVVALVAWNGIAAGLTGLPGVSFIQAMGLLLFIIVFDLIVAAILAFLGEI